jgi:hypothetical protein
MRREAAEAHRTIMCEYGFERRESIESETPAAAAAGVRRMILPESRTESRGWGDRIEEKPHRLRKRGEGCGN